MVKWVYGFFRKATEIGYNYRYSVCTDWFCGGFVVGNQKIVIPVRSVAGVEFYDVCTYDNWRDYLNCIGDYWGIYRKNLYLYESGATVYYQGEDWD